MKRNAGYTRAAEEAEVQTEGHIGCSHVAGEADREEPHIDYDPREDQKADHTDYTLEVVDCILEVVDCILGVVDYIPDEADYILDEEEVGYILRRNFGRDPNRTFYKLIKDERLGLVKRWRGLLFV